MITKVSTIQFHNEGYISKHKVHDVTQMIVNHLRATKVVEVTAAFVREFAGNRGIRLTRYECEAIVSMVEQILIIA